MKCASVSFGKDSLAMLLRMLDENWELDKVLFFDTGMEFQAIYNIRDKVEKTLVAKGIEFHVLRPKVPFLYSMLEKDVVSKKNGSHKGYGWCGGLYNGILRDVVLGGLLVVINVINLENEGGK